MKIDKKLEVKIEERILSLLNEKKPYKISKEYIDKNSGEIFKTEFSSIKVKEVLFSITSKNFKSTESKENCKLDFVSFILEESYFFSHLIEYLFNQLLRSLKEKDLNLLSAINVGFDKIQKMILNFNLVYSSDVSFNPLYEIYFNLNESYFISGSLYSEFVNRKHIEGLNLIDLKLSDYIEENNIFFEQFTDFNCESNLSNILIDSERKSILKKINLF